jgi:hypothetical protein
MPAHIPNMSQTTRAVFPTYFLFILIVSHPLALPPHFIGVTYTIEYNPYADDYKGGNDTTNIPSVFPHNLYPDHHADDEESKAKNY